MRRMSRMAPSRVAADVNRDPAPLRPTATRIPFSRSTVSRAGRSRRRACVYSYLELQLTAADTNGLSSSTSVRLDPLTVDAFTGVAARRASPRHQSFAATAPGDSLDRGRSIKRLARRCRSKQRPRAYDQSLAETRRGRRPIDAPPVLVEQVPLALVALDLRGRRHNPHPCRSDC